MRLVHHLQPHIRMAWLIQWAGAAQMEATQLTLGKLHQGRELLKANAWATRQSSWHRGGKPRPGMQIK